MGGTENRWYLEMGSVTCHSRCLLGEQQVGVGCTQTKYRCPWGLVYSHGLIPPWMRNCPVKCAMKLLIVMFQNLNGATVEVWKWVSNFTPHIIMDVMTHPYWDSSQIILVKGASDYRSDVMIFLHNIKQSVIDVLVLNWMSCTFMHLFIHRESV